MNGKVPHYLVSCVRLFLADCKCRLIFQGSPNIFLPVEVGTPQGFPGSPLLFVIYVCVLHMPVPHWIRCSYVDDFAVSIGSLSYRRNCQMFQHMYAILK